MFRSGKNNKNKSIYHDYDRSFNLKPYKRVNYKKYYITIMICLIILSFSFYFYLKSTKTNSNNKSANTEKTAQTAKKVENTKQKEEEERKKREEEAKKMRLFPTENKNAQEEIGNIYSSKEKVAYLTYDDGPSTTVTPQILDLLKEEKIPATFFVMGKNVEAHPELVKRAFDEGHYIANHSYTHVYREVYASVESALDEIKRTDEEIKKAIGEGYNPRLFRFPGGSWGGYYGEIKKQIVEVLKERGEAHTNWNALTADAAGATTVEKQLESFEKTRKGYHGLIVLMHDAHDKKSTPETSRRIIKKLKEEGYVFKNFYEIFKRPVDIERIEKEKKEKEATEAKEKQDAPKVEPSKSNV